MNNYVDSLKELYPGLSNIYSDDAILKIGLFSSAFAIIMCIVTIIATWRLFKKAGVAGWKSLIPFYNAYVAFSLVWSKKAFNTTVCFFLASTLATTLYSKFADQVVLYWIILIAGLVAAIMFVVYSIRFTYKVSKSFGHGIGFTLGLIILEPIFVLILGFGKSKYIGNTTQTN